MKIEEIGSDKKRKMFPAPMTPPHSPQKKRYHINNKYRNYCIRNNIRIAPKAIYQDPNNWHIEVRLGPYTKGEKGYVSPNVYDRKQIWPEYFLMCKYYYDKKNKK